ncbi:OLC1v1020893C1 [Oldenlandia corymbosa var. corymbosa]|uniref:F-box protein n=1 Tax=Oldenlandia corymbosa var. corymbosa TaxID=529605 RepID=A0AAV1BUG5_OLDCO|nr:OLC1v1020893C1 [Oldenlandia corymbosa var. corymbosa]
MEEKLPSDLWLKILCLLDHQSLATAQLVCRKWRFLASDDTLWSNLFIERWGTDRAAFFSPAAGSKLWKDVYVTQDRGDRIGLGLKIIREGDDYYLVHLGEIQRHLGSRRPVSEEIFDFPSATTLREEDCHNEEEERSSGILDKILFFIGDLESASLQAKRSRVV